MGVKIKQCPECSEWFEAHHHRQKFCSPRCKNRAEHKRWYDQLKANPETYQAHLERQKRYMRNKYPLKRPHLIQYRLRSSRNGGHIYGPRTCYKCTRAYGTNHNCVLSLRRRVNKPFLEKKPVHDYNRHCQECEGLLPNEDRHRKYCFECRRRRAREATIRRANAKQKKSMVIPRVIYPPAPHKTCESCQTRIVNPHWARRFCITCSRKRQKEKMREYARKRYARMKAAYDEVKLREK